MAPAPRQTCGAAARNGKWGFGGRHGFRKAAGALFQGGRSRRYRYLLRARALSGGCRWLWWASSQAYGFVSSCRTARRSSALRPRIRLSTFGFRLRATRRFSGAISLRPDHRRRHARAARCGRPEGAVIVVTRTVVAAGDVFPPQRAGASHAEHHRRDAFERMLTDREISPAGINPSSRRLRSEPSCLRWQFYDRRDPLSPQPRPSRRTGPPGAPSGMRCASWNGAPRPHGKPRDVRSGGPNRRRRTGPCHSARGLAW